MNENTKARCIDIYFRLANGEYRGAKWKSFTGKTGVPETRFLAFSDGFSILVSSADVGCGHSYLLHVITPQGSIAVAKGFEHMESTYPFDWEGLEYAD